MAQGKAKICTAAKGSLSGGRGPDGEGSSNKAVQGNREGDERSSTMIERIARTMTVVTTAGRRKMQQDEAAAGGPGGRRGERSGKDGKGRRG
eukprot:768370-Hanusia_phi.AAC.6